MNAVIASHSYPSSRNLHVPGGKPVVAKQTQPSEDMQRPVRMRLQSLNEATAVLTYSNNAGTVHNHPPLTLDVYA